MLSSGTILIIGVFGSLFLAAVMLAMLAYLEGWCIGVRVIEERVGKWRVISKGIFFKKYIAQRWNSDTGKYVTTFITDSQISAFYHVYIRY